MATVVTVSHCKVVWLTLLQPSGLQDLSRCLMKRGWHYFHQRAASPDPSWAFWRSQLWAVGSQTGACNRGVQEFQELPSFMRYRATGKAPSSLQLLQSRSLPFCPQKLPSHLPEQCHQVRAGSHTSHSRGTFSYQLISLSSFPLSTSSFPMPANRFRSS